LDGASIPNRNNHARFPHALVERVRDTGVCYLADVTDIKSAVLPRA